jgi:hypothetical protein
MPNAVAVFKAAWQERSPADKLAFYNSMQWGEKPLADFMVDVVNQYLDTNGLLHLFAEGAIDGAIRGEISALVQETKP